MVCHSARLVTLLRLKDNTAFLIMQSSTVLMTVDDCMIMSPNPKDVIPNYKVLVAFSKSTKIPTFHFRREGPYSYAKNSKTMFDETLQTGRKILVICGWLLEGVVTQLAKETEFDVIISGDLTNTADPSKKPVFLNVLEEHHLQKHAGTSGPHTIETTRQAYKRFQGADHARTDLKTIIKAFERIVKKYADSIRNESGLVSV